MKPFLVGSIEMKYPIIVGAGVCKYPTQLNQYLRDDLPIGAITLGSITPNASLGNEGILFYPNTWTEFLESGAGQNSFGMPNDGYEKSCLGLPETSPIPIIGSIAAFSIEGFLLGIRKFDEYPIIRVIKLNISCPNKGKIPIGFDLIALRELILGIRGIRPRCPIWIKLPRYVTKEALALFARKYPQLDFSATPTIDESFLREFADLIGANTNFIRALVVGNTLGNVVRRHPDGTTVTTPNSGQAGLSGPIVRKLSIGLLMRLIGLLGHTVDFIGSGGIITGDDAMEYLEHEDISAVCCTSGPFWYGDGPRFFANLLNGSERFQNYLLQHSE
jgi:dihydroorotate dehydrogenase